MEWVLAAFGSVVALILGLIGGSWNSGRERAKRQHAEERADVLEKIALDPGLQPLDRGELDRMFDDEAAARR